MPDDTTYWYCECGAVLTGRTAHLHKCPANCPWKCAPNAPGCLCQPPRDPQPARLSGEP